MNPYEKFNRDVWFVLQKIKEENLRTASGKPIEYIVKFSGYQPPITLKPENEPKILKKIEELLAIQIIEKTESPSEYHVEAIFFYLKILQPKFDELYKKYEIANSPKGTKQWVKPILRKLENGKLPYKKDGLFYSLWKYANASRLTGKSLITFMDLAPLEGNPRFAIFEFLNSLQELKIELEDITFHKDIYKKYCKTEHDYIMDYITKNPNADFSKAVKKLLKNQATFEDVFKILGKFDELVKMKLQLNGLLEFIEFSPSPSLQNIKPLKEHLGAYLKCFIEDKLFSPELKNFYRFLRQKEIFLQQIEKEVKDYGLEFVFRQGEIISVSGGSVASIGKDESYLFIHTLAAMEKQDYFEIESILITDMDVPPEKQTDDYKVKILASEKLSEEYKPKISHTHEQIQKIQNKPLQQTKEPLHIVIDEVKKDIGIRGFEEKVVLQKPKNKKIQLHKFPVDLKWEEISIQFLNEHEVIVKAKNETFQTTYEAMGFQDERKKLPNKQWEFLQLLSTKNGEVSWENNQSLPLKQINSIKKQKQLQTEALKAYFQIYDSEPFQDYKIEKAYRIKITLTPEPELKDINEREVYDE